MVVIVYSGKQWYIQTYRSCYTSSFKPSTHPHYWRSVIMTGFLGYDSAFLAEWFPVFQSKMSQPSSWTRGPAMKTGLGFRFSGI